MRYNAVMAKRHLGPLALAAKGMREGGHPAEVPQLRRLASAPQQTSHTMLSSSIGRRAALGSSQQISLASRAMVRIGTAQSRWVTYWRDGWLIVREAHLFDCLACFHCRHAQSHHRSDVCC